MSAPRILGCDPGLAGALALLVGDEIKVWDSPVVASEIDPDELTRIIRDAQPDFAVIERVASMPGNGSASMFSFGKSYGMLRGVVAACGVPYHLVPPTVWKKHFKLTVTKELESD
jgi:hypothetical protein